MSMHRLLTEINYSVRQPVSKVVTLVALLAIILSAIIYYTWYPVHIELTESQQKLQQNRNAYLSMEKVIAVTEQYRSASHKIKDIEQKLNIVTTQSEIIKNISKLAIANSIKITKDAYKEEAVNNIHFLKQDISIEGTYNNIKSFIVAVNNSPYLSHIKQSVLEKKQNAKTIDAKLIIISYMRTSANE